MKCNSVLTALLLMSSASAMNQDNYSAAEVRSMLVNILQSFQAGDQRRAEQMQTLLDQHKAETDQLRKSLNDMQEALAQSNRQYEMLVKRIDRIDSELQRLRRDSNVVEYLVPSMDSDTQDGYIASASSTNRQGRLLSAYRAFQRPNQDRWQSEVLWQTHAPSPSTIRTCDNIWLQIQFPIAKICDCVRIKSSSHSFTILGSNDGQTWDELLKVKDAGWHWDKAKSWDFNNITPYSYYRMNITKNYGNWCSVAVWSLDFLRK